jgi:PKD repeat protein
MKQKITRVLLFSLIVSLFIVCTVSAMWSATGNGLKNTEINRVSSAIQPSIANNPGTCSIVGVWTNYDATSPNYPWSTTFNSDGTWSDDVGESGTWIVIDAKNHIYQFEAGGIWTFTLSSDCSSFTATNTDQGRTVYGTRISTTPVAGFSALPVEGTVPLTVQFTDRSTGDITSWNWDFGDSYTSSETSPSHEYTKKGLYTVKLEVNKGQLNSDIAIKTNYINVTPDQRRVDVRVNKLPKPLQNFYHTFIIYRDADGKEWYYRGGAENVIPPWGLLVTEFGPYTKGTVDWNKNAPSVTVLSGQDANNKNICFSNELNRIAALQYSYNPVWPNCNSVAYTLLKNCGCPTNNPIKNTAQIPGWGLMV